MKNNTIYCFNGCFKDVKTKVLFPEKEVQSRTKVVGPVVLDHVTPIPPSHFNVGKCRVFRQKKSPDYQYCRWGRGEFASCPNFFVWDCRSLSYFGLCTIILPHCHVTWDSMRYALRMYRSLDAFDSWSPVAFRKSPFLWYLLTLNLFFLLALTVYCVSFMW